MLKTLLIYYEPMPAGQTTHVLSLARELDSRRFQVTVVLPVNLQRSIEALRRTGVEVVPLPLRKVAWGLRAVISLACLIRQRAVDIVHVHSQEAGLLARVVARAAGAPRIVYTPQAIDIRRARWHWLYVLVERALAHTSDLIISVSEADRERMIRWGISPHKLVTIPNGVDPDTMGGAVDIGAMRRSLGLDQDRPLVMQVGRLRAQKDPLAFVSGAACVVQEHPDTQFVLVGEGPLREGVATHVRTLGLERCVHLLGWRHEAFRLMAAADVVTLTSRWEGMPYTLLEAMAMARPVVATGVNGCPEVIVDGVTGFLARPGDVGAWSRRVIDLLNDPVMGAAMGQRGRRRVEERFSLQKMVVRIEGLYSRMAEGRRVTLS